MESDTPHNPEEREITLDDLAKRYPETACDVDTAVLEIPPPPVVGIVKTFLREASMNFVFGILGGVALLWIVYYWPGIRPI